MQLLVNYKEQIYTVDLPDNPIEAEKLIRLLSQSSLPREVKDALLVRLADDEVDMYGKTIKDNITTAALTGHNRYSVQVHPYPWQPSGATNVVVYQNAYNELFVALVYNRRRDNRSATAPLRQLEVPSDWKLPEGYQQPRPAKDGEQGIAVISSNQMDEAEELKLKKRPLEESYITTAKRFKRANTERRVTHGYDKSIQACALREVSEEIGLNIPPNHAHLVSLREESAIIGIYLITANSKNSGLPKLKVDGIEIANAIWGKLKGFQIKVNEKVIVELSYYNNTGEEYPVEVTSKYAITIGLGIQHFRNMEIQAISNSEFGALFSSRENIEAKVCHLLKAKSLNPQNKNIQDILGLSPEEYLHLTLANVPGITNDEKNKNIKALASLGKYAENYHMKILSLAEAFSTASADIIFNAEALTHIINESIQLNINLSSSKVSSLHRSFERLHTAHEDKNSPLPLNIKFSSF